MSMYSPLSTMSKVHPPLTGEGCRRATVLLHLGGRPANLADTTVKPRVELTYKTMVAQPL